MLTILPETSIFLSLLRKPYKVYYYFKSGLNELYKNSQIRKIFEKLFNRIKTCFKLSFLGRVSELKKQGNYALLENSSVLQRFRNLYKNSKFSFISYFKNSKTNNSISGLKNEAFSLPVKTASIIIIVAIITNIIFSILFKQKIEIFGWIIRGLLFFAAICGLNSQVDCSAVKSSSLFLRLLSKKCVGSAER